MIITEEKRDVQSSGCFENKQFSIRANSKAFSILTDKIYTHKVMAVIREISCNAYDSHVAAGNLATPFKVHLPTSFESWFSVRDYGTGISHEQMMTLYTEFFVSTKNHSNDFVGALGIGRVSPFTIVDNFSIASYYNGVVRNYSCYKDTNGEPTLAFLSEEATEEPNGVEVTVQVGQHMIYEFRQEAVKVYQYFDMVPSINRPEVVDDINKIKSSYIIKGDGFMFTPSYGTIKAVMGNVAYDIPTSCIVVEGLRSVNGFIKFNIGELDFDPGRESLSLSDKTKGILRERMGYVKGQLVQYMQDAVDSQPTKFKKSLEVFKLSRGTFGTMMPRSIEMLGDLPESKSPFTSYSRTGRKSVSRRQSTVYPHSSKTLVYLYKKGFDHRIKEYVKDAANEIKELIVVTQEQADDMLIDPEFILDLDTLPKPERAKYSYARKETASVFVWNGQSDYKGANNWDEESVDIRSAEEKVYVELNNWEIVDSNQFLDSQYDLRAARDAFKDIANWPKVYGVKSAIVRQKGFQKGNWVKLEDYVKREVEGKTVSVFTYSGSYSKTIKSLASVGGLFGQFKSAVNAVCDNLETLQNLGFKLDKNNSADIIEGEIIKRYPLITLIDEYKLEENKSLIKEYIHDRDRQVQKS